MKERRKHPRIDLRANKLPLLFVQDGKRRRVPLTAVNLSRKGVGFLCTQQFDAGEELQTMIILPDATPVSGPGIIRFKQEVWGLHGYGMELDIDVNAQHRIENYLTLISHGG